MTRDMFIKIFGSPNKNIYYSYSWSGKCVPCYGDYNTCGQKLDIDDDNNICIYYSFSEDARERKSEFPNYLKHDNILIAIWLKNKMEKHINKKFNSNGFFICRKNGNVYNKICFGKPFDYNHFIDNIKNKNIIFDSGMYMGNSRNYSQFRSTMTNFWNDLLVEEY